MKDNVFEDGALDALGAFAPVTPASLARKAMASSGVVQAGSRIGMGALVWDVAAPADDDRAQPGVYRRFGKRALDLALVLMSLPLVLPVLLFCAIALWVEGGQPFYRQMRLGAAGRDFSIFKLRTMCRDADTKLEQMLAEDPDMRREWDLTQKLKHDPRITRVGSFLRKTSLDELPQLLNVVRGEMSIVGPRPMLPEQLDMYPDPTPYFDLRPGITGKWQVSDRNENSFAHRSTVDAEYHDDLTLAADLRILCQTVGVVLRRTGY